MDHNQVWEALDKLAKERQISVSKMAKDAGLDSTSFNKSKRVNIYGKKRWPTTESIAKVLNSTGVSLEEFIRLIKNN